MSILQQPQRGDWLGQKEGSTCHSKGDYRSTSRPPPSLFLPTSKPPRVCPSSSHDSRFSDHSRFRDSLTTARFTVQLPPASLADHIALSLPFLNDGHEIPVVEILAQVDHLICASFRSY
eukprot:764890-Hanusia_phi.AAC.1